MNKAKLTARKLQFQRLGLSPVDLTRKELQIEWKKLVEEGKVPVLLRGTKPGEYERHLREMTRRSSRARPGRRKNKIKCVSCGNKLGQYHNHRLCNHCVSRSEKEINIPKMNIPKMTN